MAKLLYTAKAADGKQASGFVDASSAGEARDKLVAQGLSDIVLHQETSIGTDPKLLAGLDAAALERFARFQLRLRSNPGLATVLAEVARRSAVWMAIDVAVMVWAAARQRWWVCAAFGAFLLYPFVMTIWQHRHADHFQQLLKDFVLGRWDEAERGIARLAPVRSRSQTMDFDLDVRLASIRARRGDLAAGLLLVEPWRAKLASQPGLFEARVASVYASGEDRAGCVRLMGEAHAASNNEPSRALDHALVQARIGDAATAASLLAGIDTGLLPPIAKGFLLWTEGLLALRRGDATAAQGRLAEAVADFLQRADKPAVWTSLAFCTCDHAMALAACGEREQARKTLLQVMPILRAHADKALLHVLHKDLLASRPGG